MIKERAIAKTKKGALEGVRIDGIYRFLGVNYAQSTAGENRFMPPKEVEPWEGVKPALKTAVKCWQTDTPRMEDSDITSTTYYVNQQKLMLGSSEMGVGEQSEDCLALNIWTAGLDDGRNRPVMVWFHGGGNIAGAAEADWHDGYNLAKKQDVVVVNVGHRLGIFGYLYLAGLNDPKYKDCANLGHQDMVAALRWIKENIDAFGGDPGNVTIFGQSGGGRKVATLMSMPMAKGLFQKAIIQSGAFNADPPEVGIDSVHQLLDFLKIDEDHLDELQKIPPEDLIQASRTINKTRTLGTYFETPIIMDGKVICYTPDDGAEGTAVGKDVPLLMGFCKDDEILQALFDQRMFAFTEEELPDRIAELGCTREKAVEVIGIYRKLLGADASPSYVYTSFLNDVNRHRAVYRRYEARTKVGAVKMYSYIFGFEGPDPDLKAIHGVDVPFFFGNAIYAPGLWNVDTRVGAMKLADEAAAAWAAFARTGDPSNPYMPVWKPYEEEKRYAMFLDVDSRLVSRYHEEGLAAALELDD